MDWVASRCDVTLDTAQHLKRIARPGHEALEDALEAGVSFDRVSTAVQSSDGDLHLELDLAGLLRHGARRRHVTRSEERDSHAGRYVMVQPDLFDTTWKLRGLLPAVEGSLVSQVLDHLADRLPSSPGATPDPRPARRADALVQLCSQTNARGTDTVDPVPVNTTVIVEARDATHGGETGGYVVSGPRVGPSTLEAILCHAPVEVTAITADGTPLAAGTATTVIPPRVRRFVLARDGGCVIDGCTSTHRLQPHHIQPRSHLGTNHPDNLATLCWFHHHVVVHRRGYQLDPTTPPRRRRFRRPNSGWDPPQP